MRQKTKIEAFTLGEIIVVLILTSLVVGMAFSVLSLVQKQMTGMQLNYHNQMELRKLETLLNLDFNRYTGITYQEMEQQFHFTSEVDTAEYQLASHHIIKDLDTFKVQTEHIKFFFKGEEVLDGKIDALRIQLSKEFQGQVLFVFKFNDAATFMN